MSRAAWIIIFAIYWGSCITVAASWHLHEARTRTICITDTDSLIIAPSELFCVERGYVLRQPTLGYARVSDLPSEIGR